MYCKKCGTKNKDGARFCAKCGQELTQKSQVQKKPEQEPVVQKRVSPKSIIQNEHIQPKSEIHKQEVHQNRVQNEKPPKKKSIGKAILKILIFIVVCLGIGIGGVFGYRYYKQKNKKQNSKTTQDNIIKTKDPTTTTDSTTDTTATDGSDQNTSSVQTNTLPYTDNTQMLLSKCTDSNDFESVTSSDGVITFSYPKYLFNESSSDDTNDKFTLAYKDPDDDSIKVRVNIYAESASSNDPIKSVKERYKNCKESLTHVGYDYPKGGSTPKLHDGQASMIVLGYTDDAKTQGKYMLATSDGDKDYIMDFEFEDSDYTDDYKEINYVLDCMYRGCSFTNSSYRMRTYEQFKKDDMGQKK